jgi:CBS domain-containing protein
MSDAFDPEQLTVEALVGDEVTRVPSGAPLVEVARTMRELGIGAVVVGEGARPEGIVSERDLVEAMAAGSDAATTTAGDVATSELRWVDVGATLDELATEMMESWVRHVLVESDGALVGIVSMRDLVAAYASGAGPEI